jgi:hypothetical protein
VLRLLAAVTLAGWRSRGVALLEVRKQGVGLAGCKARSLRRGAGELLGLSEHPDPGVAKLGSLVMLVLTMRAGYRRAGSRRLRG